MPDFFIDNYEERYGDNRQMGDVLDEIKSEAAAGASSSSSAAPAKALTNVDPSTPLGAIFNSMQTLLNQNSEAYSQKIGCVYSFTMKDTKEVYYVDMKNSPNTCGKAEGEFDSQVQMILKEKDFIKMFHGKINATMAFMSGKLKIKGDMKKAMALEKLMNEMNKK